MTDLKVNSSEIPNGIVRYIKVIYTLQNTGGFKMSRETKANLSCVQKAKHPMSQQENRV